MTMIFIQFLLVWLVLFSIWMAWLFNTKINEMTSQTDILLKAVERLLAKRILEKN